MTNVDPKKTVRVTAMPENTEEEKQTKDLVDVMRSKLHELNETEDEKKKRELEEI